jgi:FSR family fosmidomycin resistance protein-like MFS transporter
LLRSKWKLRLQVKTAGASTCSLRSAHSIPRRAWATCCSFRFSSREKAATEQPLGVGLALLFGGGALGKAVCGWLGQHLGVVRSVIVTEAATALFIVATLMLPLGPVLILLPFLGVVLNGTSSVLYGTVPELARKGETSRAFALFYTGVIGAGGLAPIAYGAIADHSSRTIGVLAAALTAAAIIPMVLALGPFLPEARAELARPMTTANQISPR